MRPGTKDRIQYGTAIAMIASGMVLSFLSFFLNNFNIADGVLWYVAQALVYAGSIFGVNIYIRTKYGEAENKLINRIKEMMNDEKKDN